MPHVAAVLREEIARLARREVKQQVGPLKKTIAEQRRTIAALRRQIAVLARSQAFLEQQEKRRLAAVPEASTAKRVRFSPKWVRADRDRLGLSAGDYGRLVGVAAQTIYNWENSTTKPGAKALARWATVRGMGKREASSRLELLAS